MFLGPKQSVSIAALVDLAGAYAIGGIVHI